MRREASIPATQVLQHVKTDTSGADVRVRGSPVAERGEGQASRTARYGRVLAGNGVGRHHLDAVHRLKRKIQLLQAVCLHMLNPPELASIVFG